MTIQMPIITKLNKFEPKIFPIAKLHPIFVGKFLTDEIDTASSGKLVIPASKIRPIKLPSIFFLSERASAYLLKLMLRMIINVDNIKKDIIILKVLNFKNETLKVLSIIILY